MMFIHSYKQCAMKKGQELKSRATVCQKVDLTARIDNAHKKSVDSQSDCHVSVPGCSGLDKELPDALPVPKRGQTNGSTLSS